MLRMDALRDNLLAALDAFTTGVAIKRAQLRRAYPDDSDDAAEERLRTWLAERPGAEWGDGEGRPGTWPRKAE
jgi:hypothetical protein